MKRITIPINGNLESIRKQLLDELGVDMSYAQIVDYLIKFYRTHQPTKTTWVKP